MRTIQEELLAFPSVIDDDRETPRRRYYELLERLVSVTATHCAGRHIIEVINTPDRKRNMAIPLDKCEIPAVICDFGKVNDFGFFCHH